MRNNDLYQPKVSLIIKRMHITKKGQNLQKETKVLD